MRNLVVMLMVVGLSAVFSGCVQINSSDAGSMNIHPKTEGPVDGYRPVYEIGKQKVSAQSNVKSILWIFSWASDNAYADNVRVTKHPLGILFPFLNAKQTAASAAFYKACKQAKCDAIVAARYEITFEDYFFYKKMNVEVKGFPARLASVEKIKPMPFYVEGSGKIIMLDKMVKPILLYDAHKKEEQKVKRGFLNAVAEFLFGA